MKLSEAMGNPLQDYLLLGQSAKVAFCSMAMGTIWDGRLCLVEERDALLQVILATKSTTWHREFVPIEFISPCAIING